MDDTGLMLEEAGERAMRALWDQASLLITLIGLLSYVLGRLIVDAFYGQFGITADAAGVGYLSIVEPAALLTGIMAVIGAAVAVTWDVLGAGASWLIRHHHIPQLVLSAVALVAGLTFLAAAIRVEDLLALLTGTALPALRTLFDRTRSVLRRQSVSPWRSGRDSFSPGRAERIPNGTKVRRGVSVILALGALVGLSVGAHVTGQYYGGKAAAGKSVNVNALGFSVPSITASAVHVQPITQSAAWSQLSHVGCWLQLGPGGGSIVLYSPVHHLMLTVSADQVVITAAGTNCPMPPAAAKRTHHG